MKITKSKLKLLLLITLATIPKQGWGALHSCLSYYTYSSNSRTTISSSTIEVNSCGSIFISSTACSTTSPNACSCGSTYTYTGTYNDYSSQVREFYCGDVNCSTFSSGKCTSCPTGFNLDSSYGCCLNLFGYTSGGGGLCNVASSHACSTTNCGSGKYRLSYSGSCTCSTCPSNASCTGNGVFTCNEGYYKSSVTATSCTACSTGATACTSASVHTSCSYGYYLSGTTCVKCPDNATCTGGSSTFSCYSNYEASNGQCVSLACATGLYRDTSGNCASCPTYATCTDGFTFSCGSGFTKTDSACTCSGYVANSACYSTCPTNAVCDGTDFVCYTGYTKETYTCSLTPTVISTCPSGSSRSLDGCCCER